MAKQPPANFALRKKCQAVIYGGAKEINFFCPGIQHLKISFILLILCLADVSIDGATYRCVLKDIQFDKVSDQLIHARFFGIS
ncbi:MAG: hypothetical protein WKF59_11030 [Chitinophagaceae bacterium]